MDRYRLIVLASVISWHAGNHGQQAEEKQRIVLPQVLPISSIPVPPLSPQLSSSPVVAPAAPASSPAAPVIPPASVPAQQQPQSQDAQKKQEMAAQAADSQPSIATSPVTPVSTQPTVSVPPQTAVLAPTAAPVVVQPIVQQPQQVEIVPPVQENAATDMQEKPVVAEQMPQQDQKEQEVSTISAEVSTPTPVVNVEEAKKEDAVAEKKATEPEKSTQESMPSTPTESPATAGTATVSEEELLPDIVGIDTVNVEAASGNWLLKRIWFERALEQYEKTKALFDKVLELRFAFFAKRTELDRTLFDPFYMKVGIGQGELLEIINRLLQDFQEMRNKEGALTAQENVLYERVEQEKETLERLQKDITGVTEIDAAVETAINQLVEQVNTCRTYEKQAWETFKEISKQLSDKKARELYYVMDTYRKNSSNIVTYLQRDFSNYMQLLERMAHEQIDRIMIQILNNFQTTGLISIYESKLEHLLKT